MLRPAALILALAPLYACNTPVGAGGAGTAARGASAAAKTDPSLDLIKKEAEQAKLRRDLDAAELDLRLSTLKAEAERQEAARKVQAAQHALYTARDELSSYREVQSAQEREEVQLQVDRSTSRLTSQRADLEGILEIYREEEEARAKDEIIRRHQESVAFAERELEQARSKARLVLEFKVPRQMEQLEWNLAQAEAALAAAERAQERAELEGRLSVSRKEAALKDTTSKLELATLAVDKARAKAKG